MEVRLTASSRPSRYEQWDTKLINLQSLEELATDMSMPPDVRRISSALAAAITDWPTYNLVSVEHFLLKLKQEFGELSKVNLCCKMKNLSVQADAWKLTSLSELLEAWDSTDEAIQLDELVQRIMMYRQ
jgi:hypothetical protein